ncbi:Diacylglycerol kinase family enzyme [Devosia crocina]|uniref:Diacylglycerol kinase family enzyme n=1 Tax=Devosia crocina TaxID=429728 RepID=A0A1I7N3S5_9HYPH|nr:diacylglycerol kinase family protein [Devosia crocina]SFV29317.1 Diacylglycerol kinase family enzyme [Devosia crocina]
MRIAAILNRDSGTLRTMDLAAFCREAEDVFASQGHELTCQIVGGSDVLAAIKDAAHSADNDAVIAAGGDGTISSAAGIAYEAGKVLGILPAGTMNLFARALGVPLDIHQALRAVAEGEIGQVDLAMANGRPFVHQFGVGIHPRLVRIRDGMVYRSRVGKMLASLRAIAAAAVNPPRFEVTHDGAGERKQLVVSGIAVSNNRLDDTPVPVPETLDGGRLGVYFADTVTTGELLSLVVDVLTGQWRANPRVSELETDRIVFHFPKRKHDSHAVIDGELIKLDREVEVKILPRALKVIVPATLDAPTAEI